MAGTRLKIIWMLLLGRVSMKMHSNPYTDHFVDANNMVLNDPSLNHFPNVRNKVDEEKLESLWQKGSKAWIDVHNPVEWVEIMRDDRPWKEL